MAYVSEKGLGDLKEKGRKMFLSGSKAGKGNAYFRKNAFLLGRYALEMKEDQDCDERVIVLSQRLQCRSEIEGKGSDSDAQGKVYLGT
jgi:hypothetical protein